MRRSRLTLLCALCLLGLPFQAVWAAPPGGGVWFPASEPEPFLPDAARFLQGPGAPTTASDGGAETHGSVSYARTTWRLRGPVRRAVLCLHSSGAIRGYFDGRLVFEPYQRDWIDVTDRLQPGPLFVALRSYGDWGALFYAQMRVEYRDGAVEDLVTRPDGWEIASTPAADWMRNPHAAGDWQAARDAGGYAPEPGQPAQRHQEFALLSHEALHRQLEPYNAHLRREWGAAAQRPPLRLEAPLRPEWRAQFRTFCRLNAHGELLDGTGQVRHLLFTIYTNHGALSPLSPDFDWDQYERDLRTMADAGVNPYLRFIGLGQLLDRKGDWARLPADFRPHGTNLPHFDRMVDLLDRFVARAHAMGRYLMLEGDFYWNAPSVIAWPFRERYHLYPEVVEANALAHRKVMCRYADCPNVLGYMIGEEDILLAYDLANPHQHALFTDSLRRTYGTLENFKRRTHRAYDLTDLSGYRPGLTPPGYWEALWRGMPREPALVPGYTPREGVFDGLTSWDQIPLPGWPTYRSLEAPHLELGGYRSLTNEHLPFDPLWTDFYRFQQDERFFGFVSRWARIVRAGCPHQLLFFCNAQDSEGSWHWPELFRRADLPFDVIGVGDHDAGNDLADLPPWYTLRKAIKTIASYRPYVRTPGAIPKAIATGEGEIGKNEHPQEVLNGYRGYLFDEIGGGGAWTQTYTWAHMTGGDAGPIRENTPFLNWCGPFMRAVQGVSFHLDRPVRVLLVRNYNLENSNRSGLDFGDMYAVADVLSRLNVEFDVVMGRDLSDGPKRHRVDLTPYQLVVMPHVAIDQPASAWEALDRWLSDPHYTGRRVLALGRIDLLDSRFQPTTGFNPLLRRWLGASNYAAYRTLRGRQSLVLQTASGPQALQADFGDVGPTGLLTSGVPCLIAGSDVVGRRIAYRGNTLFAFGFPLGFTSSDAWGNPPVQRPVEALVPLYEEMVAAAQIDRPVRAPQNLRVAVSDDGRMILIRERQGLATDGEVSVRLPSGVRYLDLPMTRTPDGYAHFPVHLGPWSGAWWKAP